MDTSFEIKASTIPSAGNGVFALKDFNKGSFLEVKPRGSTVGVEMLEKDIPAHLLHYCIALADDKWICPRDFNNMEPVWYLNHSEDPNAELGDGGYYSISDIRAGEEILIDYNQFNEPEEKKESFYRK